VRPVVRKATLEDVPVLLEIEHESFSNPHWRARDFLENECVVAVVEGRIAGFLVSRQIFPGSNGLPPEREILNLAVARPFRRMGIATFLMRQELNRKAMHFLEVRKSNAAAQRLYHKIGFVEVGRRRNYYQNPLEEAIVMKMK
jgi:[ribosomal protein S18]-alanine N-acetyltransferase